MNPRTTGLLGLAALALFAFVYFYELEGESARLEAEERTRRLFPGIEAEDVSWIALETSDGVAARFERADGVWRLVSPVVHPADAAVGRMAESLASLTHEAVFPDPQPDAEYDLDDASAKIVRFGVGEEAYALRLGRDTPVGSNAYAKSDGDASVYTVASHRKTAFARTLADLRDKQILAFDQTAIRELEARWPDGRVVVERIVAEVDPEAGAEDPEASVETTWRMRVPVTAEADGDAIDRLLSNLVFLRADGFVDTPTAAELASLDPPAYAITLRRDGAEAPVALAIGRADAEDRRLVRAGDGPLFSIAAERIEDFPRETAAYRDRVLARLDPSEVTQIDFFFQSQSGDPAVIRATRDDEGWSSTPEPFDDGKLETVVAELTRLEADDVLAESMGEDELEGVGLSPPVTILTVFGPTPEADAEPGALPAEAPILAELHFGAVSAEGVVVRRAGRDPIYRLGIEIAERLPVNLAAFENRFRAPAEPEDPAPPAPDARADLLDAGEESP